MRRCVAGGQPKAGDELPSVRDLALAAVSLLYGAWRWWRMGAEPSALPVGRFR